MRSLARIAGITWMALCGVLWLWLGLAQPLGRIDESGGNRWGVLTLLSDSQFGLTMVPLLLGGLGYLLWSWGRGAPR
jgi:hypothetical protein